MTYGLPARPGFLDYLREDRGACLHGQPWGRCSQCDGLHVDYVLDTGTREPSKVDPDSDSGIIDNPGGFAG